MKNTVQKGDCLELMKSIESKSIDMILCDLPYGTTACKWDEIIQFNKLWEQYERIIKDNGAIVLTASQPFTSALVMSNPKLFKYEWIWDKKRITNPMMAKKQPLKQHENVLVFYKKQCVYNPQPFRKNTQGLLSKKNLGKSHNTETLGKSNLITSDNDNEFGYPRSLLIEIPVINNLSTDKSGLHPTQKPIALFEYLIKTYTNEGDIVLDNCAGSGTTAIACINTNRDYILMEQDDKYFELINKRIINHNPPINY